MLTVTVIPDDGARVKVKILTRDILVWERAGRDRVFANFMQNVTMVDLYWLAWTAARRLGHYTGDLRSFEESVEVEPEFDEDEVDPTRPAQSAGSSSRSPSPPVSRPARGRAKASAR